MRVNPQRARKFWQEHKHNSWLFFILLVVVTLLLSAVGVRFLKPPAVISLLISVTLVQTLIFLNSGRIVILLMGCQPPDAQQQARLQPILNRLVEKSGLSYMPALFIAAMEVPNAFAFGTGLMGGSGIAVTKPILEILDDRELGSVLAHELGHIVSRDTALMTMISITLTVLNNMTRGMSNIGRLALVGGLLIEVIAYFPRVIAAGITQLREYAADAYSAYLTEDVEPMISAFKKMRTWHETNEPKRKKTLLDHLQRNRMDELLLSHPDMSKRINMLNQLREENHESV
ncbi:M48 family metalloprotease [Candidatus Uhrbacteria bacterium]|nr:M48 family metalloprotease [Candidatus Uhrbacteria bacterium]